MNHLAKWIERILQVFTIFSGFLAIIEMVQVYIHKKELKKKADAYLDEELELEGNVRGSVAVYSPRLKEQEKKAMNLVAVTGVGCILVMILHFISRDRY